MDKIKQILETVHVALLHFYLVMAHLALLLAIFLLASVFVAVILG